MRWPAKRHVAVVIPARDEELTVADVIGSYCEVLAGFGARPKVHVTDDGSCDHKAERARAAGATVYAVRDGSGLARAFNTGIEAALAAGADVIVHTDADGQYPAASLPALLDRCLAGADLVVGDRLHDRPEGMSDIRLVWNRHLTELVALMAGVELADAQCGLRVFRREVAAAFRITSSFTYTQEQIIRAGRAGFSVDQVPIDGKGRAVGRSRLVTSPLS